MHNQLLLATLVIVFSVVLQSIMFGVIHHFLDRARNHLIAPLRMPMAVFMLVASALWLVVGIAVSIWTWAGLFYVLSDLPTVETSIYFATVAFTTLGFGDILVFDGGAESLLDLHQDNKKEEKQQDKESVPVSNT